MLSQLLHQLIEVLAVALYLSIAESAVYHMGFLHPMEVLFLFDLAN
jgi:hypothetical protein